MTYNEVTLEDLAQSFGTTVDDIPEDCKSLVDKTDLHYRRLSSKERDKLMLSILRTIEEDGLVASGQERLPQWERGWTENLQRFVDSNYKLEALIPKYIKTSQPVRLEHEYIMPCEANFEFYFTEAFRLWLFEKYLRAVDTIYEFGCGTGYNLTVLTKLFPNKKLYGLDWSEASQRILYEIVRVYGYNIEARPFNFYSPDEGLEIVGSSAIITFAALEQVGNNYEPFLQYILKQSPVVCVNVEPLCELYDDGNLVDYLAIRYHKKRNYLNGYLSRLKELESGGEIEIVKVQRLRFGNLYHEAYSYVVWKPK